MSQAATSAQQEIEQGQRFAFGANWASFLSTLDEDRIRRAEDSLKQLLQVNDLRGRTFLDVGSGSGLFSLAARRLGAQVRSFDFDPQSVACTRELQQRYFPDDSLWVVTSGSALDQKFLQALSPFDIVYSWGVLHHTGAMWQAIHNVAQQVKPGGRLAIALYNDQGWRSHAWRIVKQLYCSSAAGRFAVNAIFLPWFWLRTVLLSILRGRNEFAAYRRNRGMSIQHDWADWLGGLPFEVATPEQVTERCAALGFSLVNERRTSRLGCNEFVFRHNVASPTDRGTSP